MKALKWLLICTVLVGAMPASSVVKPQIPPGPDLIDTAMGVHKFDTFLELLRDSDLTFFLKGKGPFTIFAPTEGAFNKMPDGLLNSIQGDYLRLRRFVLHHVVRGSFTVEQALKMHSLTALDGSRLIIHNSAGKGTIGGAGFAIGNIHASNGTLHGLDTVMLPKGD